MEALVEKIYPIIFESSQRTQIDITSLELQLRSLLASEMKITPKDLDTVIDCLLKIVIKRRRKQQLSTDINRLISTYLSIPDAGNYLLALGTKITAQQRKKQLKERWEKLLADRRKEYQKLIADKKYWSWDDLLLSEIIRGRPFKQLIPFITAQNIPNEKDRSRVWDNLLREADKRGRPFNQLIHFITAQNIPNEEYRSRLWADFIMDMWDQGMPLKELVPFMTTQNIPHEEPREYHKFWEDIITEEYYRRGMLLQDLAPLMSFFKPSADYSVSRIWESILEDEYYDRGMPLDEIASLIPPELYHLLHEPILTENREGKTLSELQPLLTTQNKDISEIWYKLVRHEYAYKKTPFGDLIPFLTPQNFSDDGYRSMIWKYLIEEEKKKGVPSVNLLPFVTRENIPLTESFEYIVNLLVRNLR